VGGGEPAKPDDQVQAGGPNATTAAALQGQMAIASAKVVY
jgi:hypothetical protein